MYIVANVSKRIISLSDLNITIPPNQSRDLHKLTLPMKPDKSTDLNVAVKKGYLKVVKRDTKIKHVETVPVPTGIDQETLAKVLRKELKNINSGQPQSVEPTPAVDQNAVIKQMMIMMEQMKNMMQQQSSNSGQNSVQNDGKQFDYDDINIDDIAKIHAKAVQKITRDAEASIEYEQESTKDSNLLSRADELGDIL